MLKYVRDNSEVKTGDNNIEVKVTPKSIMRPTIKGNVEYKKRVEIGSTVKLEADRESASDYYFACWKIGSNENYSISHEFTMPDSDYYIKAYWSKEFIMKMHKILDDDKDNFPSGVDINNEDHIGSTVVALFNGNEVASWDPVRNNKDLTLRPSAKPGKSTY